MIRNTPKIAKVILTPFFIKSLLFSSYYIKPTIINILICFQIRQRDKLKVKISIKRLNNHSISSTIIKYVLDRYIESYWKTLIYQCFHVIYLMLDFKKSDEAKGY